MAGADVRLLRPRLGAPRRDQVVDERRPLAGLNFATFGLASGAIATSSVTIHPGRFTERLLRVGATALAIGVLTYFAARSVNGGLAGLLLSALISGITVGVALGVVTGMWRESQRVEPRHAVLGGCMTAISLCGMGGVLLCFGNQLLLGAIVGGVGAFMNHRQGWIQWQALIGVNPAPTPTPDAPATPTPLVALNNPRARAGAVVLAIALLLAGVFFWGLGAIRSLETTAVAGDMGCTAPCGMQHGLWVQVLPDAQGKVVSRPAPGLIEMRLSFHDDEPGLKDVSRREFSLSGPDPQTTYEASLDRPGCAAWTLRLQLDDSGKTATVCFLVPEVDPAQLYLDWGSVVMPLGEARPNFALGVNAG